MTARKVHGPFLRPPSARSNSRPSTATISLSLSPRFRLSSTTTYGEIQTKKGGPSNEQSNARALASALADSTTHLVVKINDKSIANRVNLSHFNAACKRVGLKMLKKKTCKTLKCPACPVH
eukprot:scaffold7442_cov101-Isochrysis_galbana.AAC.5